MSIGAKAVAARAAAKGMSVVGATALKIEPEHSDGGPDGPEDDTPSTLDATERLQVMTVAATTWATSAEFDISPTPKFDHPIFLAEAMRAWIEEGDLPS